MQCNAMPHHIKRLRKSQLLSIDNNYNIIIFSLEIDVAVTPTARSRVSIVWMASVSVGT